MRIRTMCYRLILLLSALMCLLGLSGTPADAASDAAVQVSDAGPVPPLELSPEERAWIAAHRHFFKCERFNRVGLPTVRHPQQHSRQSQTEPGGDHTGPQLSPVLFDGAGQWCPDVGHIFRFHITRYADPAHGSLVGRFI